MRVLVLLLLWWLPVMAVAQTDARRLLADDPDLSTPRGKAARMLLWLLDQRESSLHTHTHTHTFSNKFQNNSYYFQICFNNYTQ